MTNKALKPIEGHQPPPFNPPALEVVQRHSGALLSFEYDDQDESGKPVVKQWPLERIGPNTNLIPKADCRACERELEDALVPANYDQARDLARRVMGRYPRRDLNDPDVFVVELTRVFAEAPADLGDKAADALRSCKFLPNVGDVTAALKPLVEDRRRSLHQVRLHWAEHERRAGKRAPPGELAEKISRFKSLAPAIKAAVGDEAFNVFWPDLWLVSDDGETMVVAQPTSTWRDLTAPHVAAIGKVAGRTVELVIRSKPAAGSRKSAGGPRPLGDVLKGS